MDLPDNNLLINAFRRETAHHQQAKQRLEESISHGLPIRLFPTVEAGFLRVVTNPKVFEVPAPFEEAWSFLRALCAAPSVETVQWTPAARNLWARFCIELNLRGNDCNDAMLAAVAIEKGLRLVTFDAGFKRFPGLRLLLLSS